MKNIKETRTLKIREKIISSQDIRNLLSEIEIELDKLENKSSGPKEVIEKRITVESKDGSIYEGNLKDILENGGILDNKQVKSIRFYFSDYNNNLRISLSLSHSNSGLDNEVSVEGLDSVWVNGLIKKVENFLTETKDQVTFIKKIYYLIFYVFLACITFIISSIISLLLNKLTQDTPEVLTSPTYRVLTSIIYLLILIISAFPSYFITNKLVNLWPSIELQTGKDYQQFERKKRNIIWLIFISIFLPTLLTIVLHILL